MRVTVRTRGGELTIEFNTAADVASFVREMNDVTPAAPKLVRGKTTPAFAEPAANPISEAVPSSLADAWNWLVDNAGPDGATATEMANGLGIKPGMASYRLSKLVSRQLAHRVGRYRFRPGEA